MKKKILVAVSVVIVISLLFIVMMVFKNNGVQYELYDKYSITITVDMKRGEVIDDHLIEISYDGENARINSSKVNKDSYIVGERIYYLDADTFYWYRVETSYLDIYKLISSYDKVDLSREGDDIKHYTSVLDENKINDILSAMFFKGTVSQSAKASYAVVDNVVGEFNLSLENLDNYDEVIINMAVRKLDEDYEVNTSRIFGSLGGVRRYKQSETPVNVFEFGGAS